MQIKNTIKSLKKLILGYPFYRHPFSRGLFKFTFGLVGWVRGKKLSSVKPVSNNRSMAILRALKEEGYFFAQAGDFSGSLAKKQIAAENAARKLIDDGLAKIKGTKSYLLNLDLSKAPKNAIRTMYDFFSDFEIEALASGYLGEKALMVELKVLVSPPVQTPDKDGSQLWHSDFDDISDLKFFVFLDEVTEASGPLQVINKKVSKKLMDKWKYRWGLPGISHNDAIVPEQHDKEIVSLIGPAGSIVMVDAVQCLHRGSRNPQKARKILYATFNTRTSFRFPPFHWFMPKKLSGPNQSPLLHLDPRRAFITGLALND